MKRYVLLCLLCVLCVAFGYAGEWKKDILGGDYKTKRFDMPDDYSGKVVTTVIKRKSSEPSTRAVLYIHGYNDYFFQKEMGDEFAERGYNFYAVDLRKYGRSILDGQRKFDVRKLDEYFADINTALNVMKSDGNVEIILMGHSTGGLTAAYYMVERGSDCSLIKALVLNSPFLDMNLSDSQEKYLLPLLSTVSGVVPKISIEQNSNDAYSQSLLKKYHGEWDYDTEWKMPLSPPVTVGWLGAVHKAQMKLQKGAAIPVPVLLMRSDKSVSGTEWKESFNKGDCVLDVNEISTYGRKLGKHVQELVVKEGLHDLMLSRKPVRLALYDYLFNWLDNTVTEVTR